MIKNLKLRTKMLMGFGIGMLVMVIALLLGVIGLFNNARNNELFGRLSENMDRVNHLQISLSDSQLDYLNYLTLRRASDYESFEAHYREMTQNTAALLAEMEAQGQGLLVHENIMEIDRQLKSYRENFQEIKNLEEQMDIYYNGAASRGYEMLDQLGSIIDASREKGDYQLFTLASQAMEELLTARLRATKYFDFHTYDEFTAYQKHFEIYGDLVDQVGDLAGAEAYRTALIGLKENIKSYRAELNLLRDLIVQVDDLVAEMDASGPVIRSNASSVVNYINAEKIAQQTFIARSAVLTTEVMAGAGLAAVILFVLISMGILRIVLTPIETLTGKFSELAAGETDTAFRLEVKGSDEIGQMAMAFNDFMVQLSVIMTNMTYQNWLKTGQNELFDMTKDETDLKNLAKIILSYTKDHTQAQMGRMYICSEEPGEYALAVSVGVSDVGSPQSVKRGQGVIGELLEKKSLAFVEDLPEDYLKYETSLGSAKPKHVLMLPCSYHGEINGFLELGFLKDFDELELSFLDSMSEIIGGILRSAKLRDEMRQLLEKTINQSEELQMQQEELRQSNEELEEQTRALKESEQRLQAQQEELRVSNEELEQRSRQLEIQRSELDEKNKTIMASHDEIIEKAYALEEANRYKSEFLANMSHELRTPLNSILVLSQLLSKRESDGPLSDKEKSFAETIHTSGSDLLKLINGVLDLSKVEAGRLDLIEDEVDIMNFMEEHERLFHPVAQDKNIEFRTVIDPGVPEVIHTDRLRVSQVVKNLISNALKFTHEGHVTLTVRPMSNYESDYTGKERKDYLALEVADTGIGIKEDKKQVIFEAFKQEDGTTSRTYGGTGLGLTISQELARLMGGEIVLESEVGVGSRFVFLLPLNKEGDKVAVREIVEVPVEKKRDKNTAMRKQDVKDAELADGEKEVVLVPFKKDNSRQPLNILIIEDDKTFAEVLAGIAAERGYAPMIAENGELGLELALIHQPMGIILDMGLPDMDGRAVVKRLEANPSTADIPIHIISGKEVMPEDAFAGNIIGMLKKPVDIKSIYKTLAKIERFGRKGMNSLLVIGDCGGEDFKVFASLGQVAIDKVADGKGGIEALETGSYGCVVIDANLKDMAAAEVIQESRVLAKGNVPVIIFSETDIDMAQYREMTEFADSVIIQSGKSNERLADEVSLFLHDMSRTIEGFRGEVTKTLKANLKEVIATETQKAGTKVLLVDDDDRNLFALSSALEARGCVVITAEDGRSALECLEGDKAFDIILMDIMMPKMDGYETIGRIREMPLRKDIPIIALTAKAMADDKDKCIKAGANDYLTKPVDMERLMSLMKVWI